MTVSDDAQERAARKAERKMRNFDGVFALVFGLVAAGVSAFWLLPKANPWVWVGIGVFFFFCGLVAAVKQRATDNQAYRWPSGGKE